MNGLRGKRIVIAGGATGIGAATAERLAEEGASVVVGDVNLDGAQTTVKRIVEGGGTAFAVEFDLADDHSVQALVDRAVNEFGGVDGLYNVGADLSAGNLGRDIDLLEMEPAVWRRTHDVNLLGYALTCRAVLPTCSAKAAASSSTPPPRRRGSASRRAPPTPHPKPGSTR